MTKGVAGMTVMRRSSSRGKRLIAAFRGVVQRPSGREKGEEGYLARGLGFGG